MNRLYNLPIWFRLLGVIWLLLVVAWTALMGWAALEQRATAIRQAKAFSHSIHEMSFAGLTTLMITGQMGSREQFLGQIRNLGNIGDLRVLRGQPVVELFGPGAADESPRGDLEKQVLASGEPRLWSGADGNLHAVIPVRASRDYLGKDCLMCHTNAKAGDVLGATSMTVLMDGVHQDVFNFATKLFGIAVAASIPLLLAAYLFIRFFVTKPLGAMTGGLREMAEGEGDLTRRLPVRGNDEVAKASSAFNAMMDNFHGIIAKVLDATGRLGSAAQSLAQSSERTKEGIDRQHSETGQVAAAMHQMASTAQAVARGAQEGAESAQAALQAARDGNDVVTTTVERIDRLNGEIRRATDTIRRLDEDSENIGAILDVIHTIAEQTNLLALNAAIEAARAGEHGRGFTVVADEVRSLANRANESTEEIRIMIQHLQTASREAADVMKRANGEAETSASTAKEAGTALQAIHGAVERINEINNQNASAAEEQSAVTEEINRNVTNISDAGEQNAESTHETAKAAEGLGRLAEELQELVGKFKV